VSGARFDAACSSALRDPSQFHEMTERFRRINFGRMELAVTIDDPKAYSRPWTADTMRFELQPDTELLEHLCENNRDLGSLQQYWQGRDQAAPPTTGK